MVKNTTEKIVHPTEEGVKRKHFKARILFLGSSFVVLLVLASVTAYAFSYSRKILPHTAIAGVMVGGLSKEEATTRLVQKETIFLERSLQLQYQGKVWSVQPKEIEVKFDHADAIDQAYLYGKTGGFPRQLGQMFIALFQNRHYEIDLYPLSEDGRQKLSTKIGPGVEQASSETSLKFIPGRAEILPGKMGKRIDQRHLGNQLYTAFKTDRSSLEFQLEDFEPEVSVEAAESARVAAHYLLADSWKVQVEDKTLPLSTQDLAGLLTTDVERDSQDHAIGLKLLFKGPALKKLIEEWAGKVERKPVNARIKVENGVVVVTEEAKNGLKLEVDQTIDELTDQLLNQAEANLNRQVEGVVSVAKAQLRSDTISELGIKELIGTATTDFSGSPNNRKFNINVGQRALNGGLVKDGEVYSTTTTLGPVEESTGYLPELVIKDNRTIPEAGGGLCQVSTTLFRSVLNAGLPVLERTNHAYRVGYYERSVGPGLDATVYIPNPDLKWKNDTGRAIYIQSYIVENKLTFELYGTKDGRVASLSAPEMLSETPAGEPIYLNTDSLYQGETKQIETAHSGAKTLVTYTVIKNDKPKVQKFYSTYRPWPAQYLVGTKERPAEG